MERTRAAALLTVERPAPDVVRDERAALVMVYGEVLAARREAGAEPPDLLGVPSDAQSPPCAAA